MQTFQSWDQLSSSVQQTLGISLAEPHCRSCVIGQWSLCVSCIQTTEETTEEKHLNISMSCWPDMAKKGRQCWTNLAGRFNDEWEGAPASPAQEGGGHHHQEEPTAPRRNLRHIGIDSDRHLLVLCPAALPLSWDSGHSWGKRCYWPESLIPQVNDTIRVTSHIVFMTLLVSGAVQPPLEFSTRSKGWRLLVNTLGKWPWRDIWTS